MIKSNYTHLMILLLFLPYFACFITNISLVVLLLSFLVPRAPIINFDQIDLHYNLLQQSTFQPIQLLNFTLDIYRSVS
jgi:TRAP-type C4-dicarboxylate transport system permease large subunit